MYIYFFPSKADDLVVLLLGGEMTAEKRDNAFKRKNILGQFAKSLKKDEL